LQINRRKIKSLYFFIFQAAERPTRQFLHAELVSYVVCRTRLICFVPNSADTILRGECMIYTRYLFLTVFVFLIFVALTKFIALTIYDLKLSGYTMKTVKHSKTNINLPC